MADVMKRLVVLAAAAFVASGLASGAVADLTGPPPVTVTVGSLRVTYPSVLHGRYFSSCRFAVTGVRSGACVRGVVVASYRLKSNPELGEPGASFRADGVLFQLYRAPRQQAAAIPMVPPPLSLADFHAVGRGIRASTEQRELFFRAKGANYWAIAWIGKRATRLERNELSGAISSIQAK
jgi:hypothetical protein